MRADRLITLLLLLQRRGQITAAEAAEELEVSERTARRDLEALAMSGVPVYSSSGRGGGWRILGGARTDLTGLTADEARALFLAAGPSLDTTPELKQALRKLTGALPESFRDAAEAASEAIKVDPNGWGQLRGSRPSPPHQAELTAAVIDGKRVRLRYVSPRTGESTRKVSPLGLVTKRNVWYLVTNTSKGIRTFRLNRIREVVPLDEPVDRPKGFDLEKAWEEIVEAVEAKRGDIVVRFIAAKSMLHPLRYQFAGRIDIDEPDPESETITGTIAEFSIMALAGQLAGYGSGVRLIDPPTELVEEFQRIASELQDQYPSGRE